MDDNPTASCEGSVTDSLTTARSPKAGLAESARLGVVIVGRNEGDRLRRCLASLLSRASLLVYVDSGSSDNSLALAAQMGAQVLELDCTIPFTAARARNAGFAKLRELEPGLELVQFVDGDCEIVADWLEKATAHILTDPTLAIVCGRMRERYPEASVYNRLCDIEWNTPIGYVNACGGGALMRTGPLSDVGGYNPELIAGEEPDLCLRLRQRGFRIWRMDAEMALHDANITRFGQWWKRSMRSGHAYAEGFTRHRHEPGKYYAREVRSNLVWGAMLPGLILALVVPSAGWSLLLILGYPALALRVFRSSRRRRGFSVGDAGLFAVFCTLAKFPSVYGQFRYWARRLLGKRSTLIEYKRAGL